MMTTLGKTAETAAVPGTAASGDAVWTDNVYVRMASLALTVLSSLAPVTAMAVGAV